MVTPIIEDFQRLSKQCRFPWREFWRHCIATAMMTSEIYGDAHPSRDEVDYVAGLLHDVGKIAIAAAFPEYFEEIQTRLRDPGAELLKVEAEVLGFDHCEVGEYYLSAHKLPTVTIQAVRFHHSPKSAASEASIVAAVQVADLFVRHAKIGNSGNPAEVSAKEWVAADGWDLLFPRTPEAGDIARANMERSLERLSIVLEGLV
jgi:putative nucleotidyltransferase with HDIG domain